MSSASFLMDPYPKTEMIDSIDFDQFIENSNKILEDPFKILNIYVDDSKMVRTYISHRDVLKYMIQILQFSKEDLKEYFCQAFED